MSIDALTLRLIFIFIPGIIAFGIVDALGPKKTRTALAVLVNIFMMGIFSYIAFYLTMTILPTRLTSIINTSPTPTLFSTNISDAGAEVDFKEIFIASLFAVIIGVIVTVNVNRSFGINLAQKLNLTTRFSDADVWNYTFNSSTIDAWVTVRDRNKGLIYDGYVDAFSQDVDKRELLMSRVVVYDYETAAEVDQIPVIYMTFERDNMILEFRRVEFEDWTGSN